MQLKAGVEGYFARFLDLFVFNFQIDGAVLVEGWRRQVFTLKVLVYFGSVFLDLSSQLGDSGRRH